jgi:hypothetical protein
MIGILTRALAIVVVLLLVPQLIASAATAEPETVYFTSADGQTEITGYLFKSATAGPHGAVVMLHGRAGPYSANVNQACVPVSREAPSICNARTLSKRHMMWGETWACAVISRCCRTALGRAARRTASAASPMTILIATTSTNGRCARSTLRARFPICARGLT